MKRFRIISIFLILMLLFSLTPMALAEETEAAEETQAEKETVPTETFSMETSGTCGENLTWELSGGVLTISGSGDMAAGAPWQGHKEKIETVNLTGGVTTVAEGAFEGYENLTEVYFGGSLREIGEGAFRNCPGLTELYLPASFRIFGPECFFGCNSLAEVYCAGGMPSFKASCLWTEGKVFVYYPSNNPWPEEAVRNLVQNFGGKLELYPTAPENMITSEPEVVETIPPAVEPETVPTQAPETLPVEVTEPVVVVVVTEPAETAAPVPETTPEATEEIYTLPSMVIPEEEAEEEKGGLNGVVIGIVLIGGVLTFFIVGALVARSIRNKDRRYYG